MYILAIETTGAFASVALAKAADTAGDSAKALAPAGQLAFEVLAHVQGCDRYSHLQNLTPQIEEAVRMAGEKDNISSINDIGIITVSNGPGSFTGIRIGVSTGRALSQVLGIPCVAVPSLEALAMRTEKKQTLICPILDARRSQVYGGGYILDKDGFPEEIIKAGPYTVDEFIQILDNVETDKGEFSRILFTGDGVDKYGDIIKEHYSELWGAGIIRFADEEVRQQDAKTVARLGFKLLQEGKGCEYEQLKPEYMRMAEAERKLKEKTGSGKK